MIDPDVFAFITFDTTTLPGGNIRIRATITENFVDNTYGANIVGWNQHKFSHLVTSDQLTFSLLDAGGTERLEFAIDYFSEDATQTSGYGTLCENGGDGAMLFGSAADVLSCTTSLSENFNNNPGCLYSPAEPDGGASAAVDLTVDSPVTDASYTPDPNCPNWIFPVWFEVIVSPAPFASGGGFGKPTISDLHASPSKIGSNTCPVEEVPCDEIESGAPSAFVSTSDALAPDAAGTSGSAEAKESGLPPTPTPTPTPGALGHTTPTPSFTPTPRVGGVEAGSCTIGIRALVLRYIGSTLSGALVRVAPEELRRDSVLYRDVDLISGSTVLEAATENGWTVDAVAHRATELGAKTVVAINGRKEPLRTDCAAALAVGAPAPLFGGGESSSWAILALRTSELDLSP